MNIREFQKEIEKHLGHIDIKLNNKQIEQFYKYMEILIDWNEKINLTAITEPKEIIIKHFVDSLTIDEYINKNSNLIDVGTGAGFPGIPLKIMREDVNVTLLDSLNKRIKFLDYVIEKLELNNIKTIHGRAEEIGKDKKYRETYNVAVSRAVANTATLSEYLIPLVKKQGHCIYMKGPDIDIELERGKKAINVLGGKITEVKKFKLPKTEIERTMIVIKKEKLTPKKYPRKAGIPAKEPIL